MSAVMRMPERARRVDHRTTTLSSLPQLSMADELQVMDLRGCAARARNVDGLLHRLLDVVALAAHVRACRSAAARRLAAPAR